MKTAIIGGSVRGKSRSSIAVLEIGGELVDQNTPPKKSSAGDRVAAAESKIGGILVFAGNFHRAKDFIVEVSHCSPGKERASG